MKFHAEKDLGVCGLACVLCSHEDCPGCKVRGCKDGCDCSVYQCAMRKELDGCYQCKDFPCEEKMLSGIRNRAFNRYARHYGKQALLDRLHINYENGITYHKPDGLKGDYDQLEAEADILRLVRFGTHNPYVKCPVLETEHFTLRLVEMDNANDLLECYSDPKAQEIFNADKCTSDFRYQTLDEMRECVRFWLTEYNKQAFVRFAIMNKASNKAVGTIEMFGMVGQYNTQRGVLRLDISSDYEEKACLHELFSLCVEEFFSLFAVGQIVTKAAPIADKRIKILSELGFTAYDYPEREHYWAKNKEQECEY